MKQLAILLTLFLIPAIGCDDDGGDADPTPTPDTGAPVAGGGGDAGGGGTPVGGGGGVVVDPDDGVPPEDAGVPSDEGVAPPVDAEPLPVDADTTGDPLATWSRDYAAAQCGVMFRCQMPTLPWETEQECRDALKDENYGGEHLEQAIAAGSMRFDEAAAAACLQGLEGYSCDTFFERISQAFGALLPECADALTGLNQANQPCPLGLECASGFYCDRSGGCPGACVAYPANGAACEGICDSDNGSTCHLNTCVETPAIGQACLEGNYCPAPMVCDTASNTCAAAALADEPCGAGCLFGLICAGGVCAPPASIDDACFSDFDCEMGLVCVGGACDIPPTTGAPCHEGYACDGLSFCDMAQLPPTCAALPGVGASCADSMRCADAACVSGTCVALSLYLPYFSPK